MKQTSQSQTKDTYTLLTKIEEEFNFSKETKKLLKAINPSWKETFCNNLVTSHEKVETAISIFKGNSLLAPLFKEEKIARAVKSKKKQTSL